VRSNENPSSFYDDLAAHYHLIFEDWEASMTRQGDALLRLLDELLPDRGSRSVLDAAAGIGTQSLPLARLGFDVCSRDLSANAITRLQNEARTRGLTLDAKTADMRRVDESVSRQFDALIAFDNAVPHLLTDAELSTAFAAFYRVIRPGGVCLLSVRDYQTVSRTDTVLTYGVRSVEGARCLPLQAWHWLDQDQYEVTFYLIIDGEKAPQVRSNTARYYAVSIDRLLALLTAAGFVDLERRDETIYQPILIARRPR